MRRLDTGRNLDGLLRGRVYRDADLDRAIAILIHFAVKDDEHRPGYPADRICGLDQPAPRLAGPLRQSAHREMPLLGEHRLFRDITLLNLKHGVARILSIEFELEV